jgi:gamma-glutamyl:cysteine ligase YbdK (ATP-grasp superfamily)
MGQEIDSATFGEADFARFAERLKVETDLVARWEADRRLSEGPFTAGFELECWLVDAAMRPAPRNEELLAALADPLVVAELSRFNIEMNGEPAVLAGTALSTLHARMDAVWRRAAEAARAMDLRLAMIGILPTVRSADLSLANMSTSLRYKALNEQVLRLREGRPITLDIAGRDHLRDVHRDVMLEAGATSFQVHLKVPASQAAAFYNASKLASGPLVALAANSPFLFGRDLWDETRIPLFEQAVSVGDWDYAERVTFGVCYIEGGFSEVFRANRQRYPVLLPRLSDDPPERLAHLRLQNGTIWRWNRPLVGWDDDGTPHYRIEQRVAPAGPTSADMIANSAFYYGLVHALANAPTPPEVRCPFATARDTFYACARDGLRARIRWDQGDHVSVDRLILDSLLPMAADGLGALGIAAADRDHYLGIVAARVSSGRTGAGWQRAHVAATGTDMAGLLAAYLARQDEGAPVHLWEP